MYEKKYASMWLKVFEITNKARKEVYEIVEKICEELKRDIGATLDSLAEEFGFTYVIKPKYVNGAGLDCVPCVYIETHNPNDVLVAGALLRREYPEIVSASRLEVEHKPKPIKIE